MQILPLILSNQTSCNFSPLKEKYILAKQSITLYFITTIFSQKAKKFYKPLILSPLTRCPGSNLFCLVSDIKGSGLFPNEVHIIAIWKVKNFTL